MSVAATIVAVWAGAFALFAAVLVRPRRSTSGRTSMRPPMLVVRPCAGAEPALRENLLSTDALADGPARIVFTTATPDDAALPIAREVAAALRARGRIVDAVVAPTRAVNRKAGQLSVVADVAREDIVLVLDSDVDVRGFDLDDLLAPLLRADAPAAAAWAPFIEHRPSTFGDRLSAAVLSGSAQAFVLLRAVDAHALVGKAFAIRRDALHAVGGFASVADRLGEDVALARLLRVRGLRVEAVAAPATSSVRGRSLRAVLDRYARWLVVLRTQRPSRFALHPALVSGAPLLATTAALAAGPIALPVIAATMLARIVIAIAARRRSQQRITPAALLVDVLLVDLLLLLAWSRAAVTRRLAWRERALLVQRGGRLVAESDA